MGAVPSTMSASSAIQAAHAVIKESGLYQSDCANDCVQAALKGNDTYVKVPKAWWPSGREKTYKDPLCRSLKVLYGHQDAGNHAADDIGGELKRLGFKGIEGWSVAFNPDHVAVCVVYVDALLMIGSARVGNIIAKSKLTTCMMEPSDIKKYLGPQHRQGGDAR